MRPKGLRTRAHGVPAAERTHLIRALRAAVHGFVVLERRGQFAMAENVDESFMLMLNRLLVRPSLAAPSDACCAHSGT